MTNIGGIAHSGCCGSRRTTRGARVFKRLQSSLRRRIPETLLDGLTAVGLVAIIFGTSPLVGTAEHRLLLGAVIAVWLFIASTFAYKTAAKVHASVASPDGLIDLAGTMALPIGCL